MTAPSVLAALSARLSRPRFSAVDSSLRLSTLLSDTPAFSAALSRPAFSTKLSSFFSSILGTRRACRKDASGQGRLGKAQEKGEPLTLSLLKEVARLLLKVLHKQPRADGLLLPALLEGVDLLKRAAGSGPGGVSC